MTPHIKPSDEIKRGMKVRANIGGLGFPYTAEVEDVYRGRALLLPLEVPFTASTARTGNYRKRRRWVRIDFLEKIEDEA